MYLVTLENGFTFRSSVPEGMLINQSVAIYPGEGQYTLYRGEEETALWYQGNMSLPLKSAIHMLTGIPLARLKGPGFQQLPLTGIPWTQERELCSPWRPTEATLLP